MLATERERLERRKQAKAEAVDTVAAERKAAEVRRDALQRAAGYPEPVQRTATGEAKAEPEAEAEVKPYEEWTTSELSDELKERGLPHSGKKDELVARLEEDDSAED